MKTSTKGRARGGGRRVRLGRGADHPKVGGGVPQPPGTSSEAYYGPALPFEIHSYMDASPNLHRSRAMPADRDWGVSKYCRIVELEDYEGLIADQALQAGLRVSIRCPPDFAPDIAGAFAQRVPSQTVVFYDEEARRLVFRHENEEAIRDKQPEQEK
jgi:hypothetical protein